MKALLLLLIRTYWTLIPKEKRRPCIFRITCSQYVYRKTKQDGLYEGLRALRYRFSNCRAGFHLFEHPIDTTTRMILPNGQVIPENEISERFIAKEQSILTRSK